MAQHNSHRSHLLDASGQPIPMASVFDAGGHRRRGVEDYRPRLATADEALAYERPTITSRVEDLVRNDAVATAGVKREVDAVVGAGLTLASKPDRRALGLTTEQADDLAQQIETAWRSWAEDTGHWADAERQSDLHGVFYRAYRCQFVQGEALAVLPFRPRRGGAWGTMVQLVHPIRLSTPYGRTHDPRLRDGVEIDAYGAARWYHVREAHPADWAGRIGRAAPRWQRLPRETSQGRPLVVHAFEQAEPGGHRGASALAPIVAKLRMHQRHSETELEAAVVNAVLGAFVTTSDPSGIADVLGAEGMGADGYNDARMAYHDEARIKLAGSRLPVLYPGERIDHADANRPNTAFADFQQVFLRLMASALGQSYEELAMDWTNTNYSSARAALNEVWRGRDARRARFVDRFVMPVFLAWLEEAFAVGAVRPPAGAPDFQSARWAYARARWIGPGRGYVDPVKEAQGAQARIDSMTSTLADEAASLGRDWREIVEQRQREQRALDAAGLQATTAGDLAGLSAPSDTEGSG